MSNANFAYGEATENYKDQDLSVDELALYHQQLVDLIEKSQKNCAVINVVRRMLELGIASNEPIVPIVIHLCPGGEVGAKILSITARFSPADTLVTEKVFCRWEIYVRVPKPPINESAAAFIKYEGTHSLYVPVVQEKLLIDLPIKTLEGLAEDLRKVTI
jgi:hypothetical protein